MILHNICVPIYIRAGSMYSTARDAFGSHVNLMKFKLLCTRETEPETVAAAVGANNIVTSEWRCRSRGVETSGPEN